MASRRLVYKFDVLPCHSTCHHSGKTHWMINGCRWVDRYKSCGSRWLPVTNSNILHRGIVSRTGSNDREAYHVGYHHRGQRTNISHSETVGREGRTHFLEPNLAFASFDIISSFWIKKTCTHTPTVFCCIPMAVCHRWSRYLPIYISFARDEVC